MCRKKFVLKVMVVVTSLILLSASTALAQSFCSGNFDYDGDVDGTDASIFKSHFGRGGYVDPCPSDGPAPVPRTGSFDSYFYYDDATWWKGVYPLPPRFSVDGSWVTDRLTGLAWLQLPVSNKTWEDALDTCYNVAGADSRLPNIKEMMSLICYQWSQPALCETDGYNRHTEGNPFNLTSVQYCWTSTTYGPDSQHAWYTNLDTGKFSNQAKSVPMYAWCVRGGRYPTPRFTVNGDGTVTDHKLNLVWLQDAACTDLNPNLPNGDTWDETVTRIDSLASSTCGLSDESVAGDSGTFCPHRRGSTGIPLPTKPSIYGYR